MSDMTHEKKNGLLLDLLAYIHTHIHTYVSPSMQTHLCVCVCVCRDTHTLGRGAWEAAEEELEAAPGEKETWEAAAEEAAAAAGEEATASPAGGGSSFVFFFFVICAGGHTRVGFRVYPNTKGKRPMVSFQGLKFRD